MLDVLDSFSRKRAESRELIRSATSEARSMRQTLDEIATWCTRDEIRQQAHESDTRDYLLSSIEYIERIREDARVRRASLDALVKAGQAKREQLYNDAEELLGVDLIGGSEFASIRELDIQLLLFGQCADDAQQVYEQAGECVEDLRTRQSALGRANVRVSKAHDSKFEERYHFLFNIVTPNPTIH